MGVSERQDESRQCGPLQIKGTTESSACQSFVTDVTRSFGKEFYVGKIEVT